jgi:tight adherence protein C
MSGNGLLVLGLVSIFGAVLVVVLLAFGRRPDTGVSRSLTFIDEITTPTVARPVNESVIDRTVVPFGRNMIALGRRLSPSDVASRLQRQLDLAGNPPAMTPEKVLAYKGLGLVVGGLIGLLIGLRHGPVWLLVLTASFGVAGFFLPDVLVYNTGLKRQDVLRKSLPDALDMLTISVEAGLAFDAALAQVARNTDGPLSGEFFRVLKEMQIGKARAEAFTALRERTTVEELHQFIGAIVQADGQGIPIASVLREQAAEMRLKRRQRAEEAAAKVPVKILFPLVLCILPVMFIVIIGPGAIQIFRALTGLT